MKVFLFRFFLFGLHTPASRLTVAEPVEEHVMGAAADRATAASGILPSATKYL